MGSVLPLVLSPPTGTLAVMASPARPRSRRSSEPTGPFLRFRETAVTKKVRGRTVPTGEVVRTCWLEDDLGGGFMVAYRLIPQDGNPVIAEARIYPGRPGTSLHPGEWSGDVPRWGLSARLLHQLRPDTSLRSYPDIVGNMKLQMGEEAVLGPDPKAVLRRHGLATQKVTRRVGRPPVHDDLFYAVFARDYTRLINPGSDPIMRLAKARKKPRPTIDTWRRMARDRGFLSEPPPGKAGGQLTAAAKALLAHHGKAVD